MSLERTIAVVDDNPELLFLVKKMLTGAGYHAVCSQSSTELFDSLEKQRPDLIILDIMMPGMDGISVLLKLKEDSETSSIPVIFLTAKAGFSDVLRGYKKGADYYITKPFTQGQLLSGINLVFGNGNENYSQS